MLLLGLLTQKINITFNKQLSDTNQICDEISNGYFEYARHAVGPSGDIVVLKGTESIAMKQTLRTAMRTMPGIRSLAGQLGDSVARFWLHPPVKTKQNGTCVSINYGPGVANIRSINVDSISKSAEQLALSLHLMTKTVLVKGSGGSGGGGGSAGSPIFSIWEYIFPEYWPPIFVDPAASGGSGGGGGGSSSGTLR